jgi:glutathione S-transferase
MPAGIAERQRALRIIGLALAACEKAVQIIYERDLRPPERQHEPWVSRVTGQLLAACGELESELARKPLTTDGAAINQAGVTSAVAWHFTQMTRPEIVNASMFPALRQLSEQAEQLPEFAAAPHGPGTYQQAG